MGNDSKFKGANRRYDARNFCLASLKSLYILCFILRFKFTSGVDCVVLFCNLVDCFICLLSDWPIIHFYAAFLIGPNVCLCQNIVSIITYFRISI